MNVSGKTLTDQGMSEAQELAVIADCATKNNGFTTAMDIENRHSDKAVIGFADGHVALLPNTAVSVIPIPDNQEEVMGVAYKAFTSNWCIGWIDNTIAEAYNKKHMPAGWASNVGTYQGPYNPGYGAGVGANNQGQFAGQAAGCTIYGCLPTYPPGQVTTFNGDSQYTLDIPLNKVNPGQKRTYGAFYAVSLPRIEFSDMGMVPAGSPLKGWAAVQLLDTNKDLIADCRLDINAGKAVYSSNGTVICKKNADAVQNAYIAGFGANSGSLCYKYSINYFEGPDTKYESSISFLVAKGKVITSLATPNAPAEGIGGTAVVDAGAGNFTAPAFIRLAVKTNAAGLADGAGGMYLADVDGKGGVFYGWTD